MQVQDQWNGHRRAATFETDNTGHPLLVQEHFLEIIFHLFFRTFSPAIYFHPPLGPVHAGTGLLGVQNKVAGKQQGEK